MLGNRNLTQISLERQFSQKEPMWGKACLQGHWQMPLIAPWAPEVHVSLILHDTRYAKGCPRGMWRPQQ